MHYFSRKVWARMESPALPVRMFGALQWQHCTQRYSKAITELRQTAPPSLDEATRIPLADSIILGVSDAGNVVRVELHGSTRSGMNGRVQLIFNQARLLTRAPRGSWILQEEWSRSAAAQGRSPFERNAKTLQQPRSGSSTGLYRFTALCTRGLLCIECADAVVLIHDQLPESGVQFRTPFGGVTSVAASRSAVT